MIPFTNSISFTYPLFLLLNGIFHHLNKIYNAKIEIPKFKEESKPKKEEYIIENIAKALEENIECLIRVKNKFHYLGYFEDERAIGTKIEYLKLQNSTLKRYIPNIENDKDNAN